jgi:signal transduction histidine kinase
MHRLLARQLKRHLGAERVPDELRDFVAAVDAAYAQYDQDRAMLERSLEISSKELLQTNSELQAIFRALPDLFLVIDKSGEIRHVRGGAPDDAQLAAARPGMALGELLDERAAAPIMAALSRLAPQRPTTLQYVAPTAEGERTYEVQLVPLPGSEVMVVIRDATDRVKAAQAQALGEFAYVASHDLRAPLRAITQLATWLEEDLTGQIDAETQSRLALLRGRIRRMDALLVSLLEYCRAGRNDLAPETVDAAELVAGVVDLLGDERFEVRVAPLPRLTTARGPLERVFLNLLTNAIKHHDKEAGVIEVGCAELDRHYAFSVSDDGPGIPARDRARVFQMFERLRPRDEVEGAGMGLAVIRRIVESAGGRIAVDDASGRGARFTFTWPKEWDARQR